MDGVRQGRAALTGEAARHLRQVLRAERGQRYEIADSGRVYLAEIEDFGRDEVRFRVVEELEPLHMPVRLALHLALIKFDRFEWAVEKATELGVERIVPIAARRSEPGLERAAKKRRERWEKIAREGSQQARRALEPEIAEPQKIGHPGGAAAFFLDEAAGSPPLLTALPGDRRADDIVSILVGPEGGWTDGERRTAAENGWTAVSLGPTILRAETAASAALAIISAAWLAGRADEHTDTEAAK